MEKRFNTTGVCIPRLHYMVDITNKIDKISKMVHRGDYFVINRPRQYGKTTTIYMLEQALKEEYLIISISFEGIGNSVFEDETKFSKKLLEIFGESIELNYEKYAENLYEMAKGVTDLTELSKSITKFCKLVDKEVVLLIDEVDKGSNNEMLLNLLGLLRNKFLLRQQGKDKTFHSVILAGVYDVKNLKLKLRQEEEKKYNSPWNIAVNFNIDMSFEPSEIKTMIDEYSELNNRKLDTVFISERLYFYTNGYPFLVSRLCQILDEELKCHEDYSWNEESIDKAVKLLLQEHNTLFDDLIKNLENNTELYEVVHDIVINGKVISYTMANPVINLAIIFGVFKEEDAKAKVNNRIFEQYIYNYLVSKLELSSSNISNYNFRDNFIINNNLDFEKILLRFQQFMKEQYSSIDSSFIEREGRLLFLAFIKPIINGVGFDFKGVQISEEKRLDIVVTYLSNKYLAELKIWRGEEYHNKGLKQLSDYMNLQGLNTGYLVIYNFNKNKEYKNEKLNFEDKEIFIVWV